MIISEYEQNTPEWNAERLGCPSSSSFGKIITSKGKRSDSRSKYMEILAGEIITGEIEEAYYSKDMKMGHEREQENINLYKFRNNCEITKIGFCWKDELKMFGSSPDALVNDNGLIEAKNAKGSVQIKRIQNGWNASEHHRQAHGQMLVTGRRWCDVVSYCRGMKTVTVRFERDEEFLKIMEAELIDFYNELQELVKKIRA